MRWSQRRWRVQFRLAVNPSFGVAQLGVVRQSTRENADATATLSGNGFFLPADQNKGDKATKKHGVGGRFRNRNELQAIEKSPGFTSGAGKGKIDVIAWPRNGQSQYGESFTLHPCRGIGRGCHRISDGGGAAETTPIEICIACRNSTENILSVKSVVGHITIRISSDVVDLVRSGSQSGNLQGKGRGIVENRVSRRCRPACVVCSIKRTRNGNTTTTSQSTAASGCGRKVAGGSACCSNTVADTNSTASIRVKQTACNICRSHNVPGCIRKTSGMNRTNGRIWIRRGPKIQHKHRCLGHTRHHQSNSHAHLPSISTNPMQSFVSHASIFLGLGIIAS